MDQASEASLPQRITALEDLLSLLTTGMQQSCQQCSLNRTALEDLKKEVATLRAENSNLAEKLQTLQSSTSTTAVDQHNIVRLNVGGEHFATTLTTLTQQPHSMLGAMFSGRHTIGTDKDGAVFIDRDGQLFHHVLAYLREGHDWEPPSDPALWKRVQREFLYYGVEVTQVESEPEEPEHEVVQPPGPEFVYAFGGISTHGDCERYVVQGGFWLDEGRAPSTQQPRQAFAAAATLGDCIYIAGGKHLDGQVLYSVEKLQRGNRNFTDNVGHLNVRRAGLALVSDGNCLYALGGKTTNEYCHVVERYNPAQNVWWMEEHMQERRDGLAAVCLGGKIYAIGGKSSFGDNYLSSMEVFDPATRRWTFVAPMRVARQGHAAVVYHDKIYVIGGFSSLTEYLRIVEIYDPVTDTWTEGPPLLTARMGCAAAVVSDKVMVMGGAGVGGVELRSVEELEHGASQWAYGRDMCKARAWFSVAVM